MIVHVDSDTGSLPGHLNFRTVRLGERTLRRYQSGEIDCSGRTSKRDNGAMRTLFFEAANVSITRLRRFLPRKAWAVRLAARKGLKKAAVAVARRIAMVMLRLWCDGTSFACLVILQFGDSGMSNIRRKGDRPTSPTLVGWA